MQVNINNPIVYNDKVNQYVAYKLRVSLKI